MALTKKESTLQIPAIKTHESSCAFKSEAWISLSSVEIQVDQKIELEIAEEVLQTGNSWLEGFKLITEVLGFKTEKVAALEENH